MTLPDVAVGQPHTAAHNAERQAYNALLGDVANKAYKLEVLASATTERQFARQNADRRAKKPLTDEATYSSSTIADANLTNRVLFPTSGLSDGGSRVMTQSEVDAIPIELGGLTAGQVSQQTYLLSGIGYHFLRQPTANSFFPCHYRTIFNGTKLQWLAYYNVSADQAAHQVYVDGQPMTLRPPKATFFVLYETLTFPDARPREIDIYTNGIIGGFYCDPTFSFTKPNSPSDSPTLFTMTDSYGMTVFTNDGNSAGMQEAVMPALVETQLGLQKHIINAVGGTGFVQRTSGSNNFVDRLADLTPANADILWIPNGSINDLNARAVAGTGLPTDATILAAVRNLLLPFRAARPLAKIIYGFGCTPPTYFLALRAQMVALGLSIQAACNDIGIYYVDTTKWLDGTGYSTSTTDAISGVSTVSGNVFINTGVTASASVIGAPVTGPNIPAGAYITAVGGPGFNVSAAPTVTQASITIQIGRKRKNGVSDWAVGGDGVHLTEDGAAYIRGLWAEKLKRILIDDGSLLNTVI